MTKSGVPRVSLQARTPQLAHEVYTKTREVTQDEGELEGKLPMRRLSFPSVLNNDELRPDEIDSLITCKMTIHKTSPRSTLPAQSTIRRIPPI